MRIYYNSSVGKRKVNEDKLNIITNLRGNDKSKANINLYCICDGHGLSGKGALLSRLVTEEISAKLVDKKHKYPLTKHEINIIFDSIQNMLATKYKTESQKNGTTCMVVCEFMADEKHMLQIMNVGDCRTIAGRKYGNGVFATALTVDHKPSNKSESERIQKLGGIPTFDGFDWRINNLSLSRAFGDMDSTPCVTHIPDIYKFIINKDDLFVVMGCDGLWDVLSNQEVVNFVYEHLVKDNKEKPANIALLLAQHAIKKKSMDNVTVIIIVF